MGAASALNGDEDEDIHHEPPRREPGDSPPTSVIDRAFAILNAFRFAENSLTLAELTRRVGLPKPTVHRLANSLVDVGALERTGGGFRLGLHMFEIGGLVPHWRILREAALPFMCDLYQATHLTVHLAILSHGQVLYLEKIRGHDDVAPASHIGGRLPAHCTGVGKAMLAFSPEEMVERVTSDRLHTFTPHTVPTPSVLRQQLVAIREAGVAFDREEVKLGLQCVAAPILNREGRAVGALSLSMRNQTDPCRFSAALRSATFSLARVLPSAAYL